MKEKKNKRYALYMRVSTEEQARSKEGSLRSQRQRMEEFILRRDKNAIILLYQDEKSAKDTDRAEFQKLLQDIKKRKVDVVVCTEISRVSRSIIDLFQFVDEYCQKYDTDFISLKEDFDTTTSKGRFYMGLCSLLAQFEREQISERVSANLQARARRGLYNGGYIYGFRAHPTQKGYLYADEHESYVINLIFDQYLKFASYRRVVDWLNDHGYRTREYTSKAGKFHPAGIWHKSTISQILQNPAYIGKRRTGKEIVDAKWDAIVSEEKWGKAQLLTKKNRNVTGNSKRKNKRHTYLLRKRVYCVHCGLLLESGDSTGRNAVYFYYRHPTAKQKEDCPHPTSIPAKEMEKLVAEQILQILDDATIIDSIADEVMEKLNEDKASVREKIVALENEINQLNKQGGGLVEQLEKYDDGYIKEFLVPKFKDISDRKKKLSKQKEKLEEELEELEEQTFSPEDIRFTISSLMSEFNEMKPRQQQRVMEILVERVELHPKEIHVFLHTLKNFPHKKRSLKALFDGTFSDLPGCPVRTRM